MKKQLLPFLLTMLMSMAGTKAYAYYDIAVANADGVTIYYKWINDKTELCVTYIGWSYFDNSERYTGNVVIPETVEYEGETYDVTSIEANTFYGCTGLTSVTIGNNVTDIGESAFYNCSGLTSVTLSSNVKTIANSTFQGCSKLASITIPDEVATIGEWAFSGCSSISSITTPNSVTSIGYCAFYKCI